MQKTKPKTSLLYLLVLIMTYYVDARGRVFPKPAIEALRGSARPGRGHALDETYWHKGQSEARGDSKLFPSC